ncbi:uncharacterized protein K02A2.6-like [Pecten maximus]|uniref:uncharacterized protein K02A2.6-like n=1 Tax=Pecten maximus TaxID=6579 RepID=UPI001458E041|nr:uncharacterized protein K02A2.6-like [Pecten maximus]
MAGKIGRLDTFDTSLESWDSYSERLEQYFICNDIKDEKKVPALLSLIGGSTYSLLRGLTAPKKPSEEGLDRLVALLKEHFSPKPLVIAERFRFHKQDQREGETIREYLAAIRKLSEHCEFGGALSDSLRDRLVCGLKNEHIQRKLLSEVDLTYDKAVDLSVAMETAARDTTELRGSISVNKIHKQNGGKLKLKTFPIQGMQQNKYTKTCYRCTGNHDQKDCRYKGETCYKCGKRGHIKKACRGKGGDRRVHSIETKHQYDSDSSSEIAHIEVVSVNSTNNSKQDAIWLTPRLNGHELDMELDTGSGVSIVTEEVYRKKLNGKMKHLSQTDVCLKTYSGERLNTKGIAKVKVEYNGQSKLLDLYIVENGGRPLFGREWFRQITLDWHRIHSIVKVHTGTNTAVQQQVEEIMNRHKSFFQDDWGTLKDIKAKLNVKPGAHPKFCKARPVPYSIKPKVEEEIDRLVKVGVLTKVNYSDWGTPIVPVIKKDGSVRLCGDFKVTLNPVLEVDQYPLPRATDIFASLAGGQKYSKLDLQHAYLQMEVDESSRDLLTINTEKGLYQFNRLVYGVASAPAVWQRAMDTVLQGLKGVRCIIDDMLITGRSDEEHLQNLEAVMDCLDKYGLRLRKDKCEFFKDQVSFCGHNIDAEGLHKSENKVKAVLEAPEPMDVSQLRAFLGLVNYYGRFLPNLSTVLHPLHRLLDKGKTWEWNHKCKEAFDKVKRLVTSQEVLTHYDPKKPLRLACDTSPVGLGAVLSHETENGGERPIAYASRTLSAAEKNYSQIDKEALGLIWGVKHFYNYVFGRKFTLITDHKPLVSIFSPEKGIPGTTAARMQRYALSLSGLTYDIEYKSTHKHGNADSLSRLPLDVKHSDNEEDKTVNAIHIHQLEQLPVTQSQVRRETTRDPVLAIVLQTVMSGWQEELSDDTLKPYFVRKNEITEHQGCLLWGMRVIIPPKLQAHVLNEIHNGHIGVVRMKAVARSYAWWPNIDCDIEQMCKSCTGCQSVKGAPHVAPLHPWNWPTKPWHRIHIDFAGPFLDAMYLIIVDAYSKWPEVVKMRTTKSEKTIDILRTVFSCNGIPTEIVSDNGPQFTFETFKNFVKANGIRHITSAPYHPRTNGLAERFVQSFKSAMKASKKDHGSLTKKLANFLLAYRNSPHPTTNESPAKLFLGRQLPSRLDLIRPNVQERVAHQQGKMMEKRKSSTREFELGQSVKIRDYCRGGTNKWVSGKITQRTGPV